MRGYDQNGVCSYTSQVDLESIDDKSRVTIFIKHTRKLNLKESLLRNRVILIRNALRKVISIILANIIGI